MSRPIRWWTSRARSTSKTWTTWPVYVRHSVGGFTYVQGLVGKYKGRQFSVVNSEVTPYPPPRAKLAVGAKRYLAEYHAQQYAKTHPSWDGEPDKPYVIIGNFHEKATKRTSNDPSRRRRRDPSKKDRPSGTYRRSSVRESHIVDTLRRYKTYQLRILLSKMLKEREDWDPREIQAVRNELKARES